MKLKFYLNNINHFDNSQFCLKIFDEQENKYVKPKILLP